MAEAASRRAAADAAVERSAHRAAVLEQARD
jgi:hypothetical protein